MKARGSKFVERNTQFDAPTTEARGCVTSSRGVGGGVLYRRQILREIFVRNLFGAFKDLHTCALGCAFALVYHARGFG